jgi:2-oxoglutarate dehydrogenase E2 component (dihydrolipoamide succinyltransferase)
MPIDIKVPSVGESVSEGTLVRWLKQDGDTVQMDDPIFELETEKATSEIPAPATGRLSIVVPEGSTVPIGATVGRITEPSLVEFVPAAPAPSSPPIKKQASVDGTKPATSQPPPKREAREDGAKPAREDGQAPLSPAARRLAREAHVDAGEITGSGRGGRVTREDVVSHLQTHETGAPEQPSASPGPNTPTALSLPSPSGRGAGREGPAHARESRRKMTGIRQRIAERLVASGHTTATLTTFNEADLSAVMALRQQYKEQFRERHGINLGLMSFFVKASIEALRAYPIVNAKIDGAEIVEQHYYDIGVAVSSERGLMVPVIRDADRLSLAAIEKSISDMAERARNGRITVSDLQGGTFTITNGGVFGSLLSTPILNPPQSAILGMHAIQKRPVVVDDQIVIRPMMYLALSYDHRLIDGRDAVLFLVRIKECIESPQRLLLEI